MNIDICLERCRNFKHACISLIKHDDFLELSVINSRGCRTCTMVMDVKSLRDAVQDISEFYRKSTKSRMNILKEHIVDIADDGACPFKTELLMESWNEEKS